MEQLSWACRDSIVIVGWVVTTGCPGVPVMMFVTFSSNFTLFQSMSHIKRDPYKFILIFTIIVSIFDYNINFYLFLNLPKIKLITDPPTSDCKIYKLTDNSDIGVSEIIIQSITTVICPSLIQKGSGHFYRGPGNLCNSILVI